MNNIAYTEHLKITEEAFLEREFGIRTINVGSQEIFLNELKGKNDELIIIISSNPLYWRPILKKFKKNTVIFILIGNETYIPEIFNSLNGIKSLKHAFVYNIPTYIKNINIAGSIIGNMLDGGLRRTLIPGSVYRDARISYTLKSKFSKINMIYSASRFPQGYSNNFANKLAKEVGLGNNSLISKDSIEKIILKKKNLYDFAFIGQQTNRRRETFLRVARKYNSSEIIYNKEFKGIEVDGDFRYLNQILSSRYVLVPPGFYNNSNHRYLESLICHSLPIILANNSIDPSVNSNWTNKLSFTQRYSVRSQLKYLSTIGEIEYEDFYSEAALHAFNEVLTARKSMLEIIC